MKTFLSTLICCLLVTTVMAQHPITNVNPNTCFCCSDFYNLPQPAITGPVEFNCGTNPKFCISACPTATITWAVSPSVAFSGQGTTCIILNPPFSSSNYSISVSIRCGNNKVENKLAVHVIPVKCDTIFYLGTQQLNGSAYQVTANPSPALSGVVHFWELQQIAACPNGTIGMTGWTLYYTATGSWSSTNPAITGNASGGYVYGGLGVGHCYKLNHYILCCGQWKKISKCFCLTNASLKKATEKELGVSETFEQVSEQDLPIDLKSRLQQERKELPKEY